MNTETTVGFSIGQTVEVGDQAPLLVIAGPCVIEDRDTCLHIAETMLEHCRRAGVNYVFKASYDKANRTSRASYRGPGPTAGLNILAEVKEQLQVPVLTDIHQPEQAHVAAEVADIIQIPAFLCRQTDLLLAAARCNRVVNVKKGQFMAPEDMAMVLDKLKFGDGDRSRIMLTERGTSFGYHNLIVDMRGLVTMRQLGVPVIFDATHAVQLPGGQGSTSGGQREFVFPLARAAAATGIDGLFMEVHPRPDEALSDGPNSLPLAGIGDIIAKIRDIHAIIRR